MQATGFGAQIAEPLVTERSVIKPFLLPDKEDPRAVGLWASVPVCLFSFTQVCEWVIDGV